eukprot:g13937.t1
MSTSEKNERSDPPQVEVGGDKPQEEGETEVSGAVVEESTKEEGVGEGQAEEGKGSGSADQGSPAAPAVRKRRQDHQGMSERRREITAELSKVQTVEVDKEEVVGGKIQELEGGPSMEEFQALLAKFPEETIGQLAKRYEAQRMYVLFQKACAGGVAAEVPLSVKEGGLEKKKDVMPPGPFGGKQPSREGYIGGEFGGTVAEVGGALVGVVVAGMEGVGGAGPEGMGGIGLVRAEGVVVGLTTGTAKGLEAIRRCMEVEEEDMAVSKDTEAMKLKERIGSVFVRLTTKLDAGMSGPAGEEFLIRTLSKELSAVTSADIITELQRLVVDEASALGVKMSTSEKNERSDPPQVEVGGDKPQEEGETEVSGAVVEESTKEEGVGEGQAEEGKGSGSADQGSPAAPAVSTDQVRKRRQDHQGMSERRREITAELSKVQTVEIDKEEVVGGKIQESEGGPSMEEFQALLAKFPEETIGQLAKRYEAQRMYVLFQKACAGGVAAEVPLSVKEGGLEKKKDVMPPGPFGGKQPSREGYIGGEFGGTVAEVGGALVGVVVAGMEGVGGAGPEGMGGIGLVRAEGVVVGLTTGTAKGLEAIRRCMEVEEEDMAVSKDTEAMKLKERIGSVFVRLTTKLDAGMSGPAGEEFLIRTLSKELSAVTSADIITELQPLVVDEGPGDKTR